MVELRDTLTFEVSVMNRPFRLDEIAFECYVGEGAYAAVVLTDYAEVNTGNGVASGGAGMYVVDGPDGVEVCDAFGFGLKYTFEPEGETVGEVEDPGFVQDLDVADEDPATAEKGVGVPGDTPGDQVPGFVDRGGTFRPDDPADAFADEAVAETAAEEGDVTVEAIGSFEEVTIDIDVPPEDSVPFDPDAPVSQFEALDDNELRDIANDLDISFEDGVPSRGALIALIDAAVAEAENATETGQ